jgi:hypothetical protein
MGMEHLPQMSTTTLMLVNGTEVKWTGTASKCLLITIPMKDFGLVATLMVTLNNILLTAPFFKLSLD